ncbi:MAG: TonB-dependent receptor [Gammaproteobacteria bacterium]|nr:TonB-dependent receptor [Gammaproteobacteria bacterium]
MLRQHRISRYAALALLASGSTFTFAQKPILLPEIAVTAARSERGVFDTPQATTVIGERAIAQANVSQTPDLLRYAHGVYVQRTNLGGGSPFIRGLTGKQVLILVDGVRLNNSFYRFGPHQYLNTIDSNIIKRIEVVRGPGSVLYGSDALGGVINIITKRRTAFSSSADLGGLIEGRYDSAVNGGGARAQFEGNRNDIGFIGGVSGKVFDDLEGGDGVGEQVPSGYDELDADLKLNWRADEHNEFIVAGQYTRQYDVPKTSEVTLGDLLKFNYEPQERELAYAEYRGNRFGPFDQIRVNLSYNRQQEGEEIIDGEAPLIETRELTDVETKGATVQLTNFLGQSHRLTYGVDYYRDDYDTGKIEIDRPTGVETAIQPGTPDGAFYTSIGAYAQDEFTLTDRADLIAGIRYSRFETEGELGAENLSLETDRFTGSLNALYSVTPSLHLVGGVAQGFRAPNIEDFFGRVDFFSEIPNTALKPEESINGEIGLKFFEGGTSADIYYFYSDYENLIDRVEVGTQPDGTPIVQRQNINEARIHGVEAGIAQGFSRHWWAAATVAWTDGEDNSTGEPLRRIPPLNGSLRVRFLPSSRLWFEAAALVAERQDELSDEDIEDPRIGPDGTPGYTVFNLSAGYSPTPHQQLLVTLENLSDKTYKTHGSGLFLPGRSVAITYRVGFE